MYIFLSNGLQRLYPVKMYMCFFLVHYECRKRCPIFLFLYTVGENYPNFVIGPVRPSWKLYFG